MRFNCRFLLCLFGFLVVISSIVSADDPDLKVEVGIKSYYTSNLYHVSERREDQFDDEDDPDERFHDMEGPDDFVSRPGFDITWKWDIAKKRDLEITFGADYYLHAQNTIADYLRLQTGIDYDLTRDDKIDLGIELIPDRFRKNLSIEDPDTSDKIFRPADYQQVSFGPRYMHNWNKDWATGIEYEYSERDYDSPFENRDRKRHTVMALVEYEGLKRIDITFGAGLSETKTSKNTEFGIEVDRSKDDVLLELEFDFNLPHRWEASFGTKYRHRDYASNEPADTARYNRVDNLWALDAEVGKWLSKNLFVAFQAGWMLNDSNRDDPTVEADEIGYEEYTIGINVELQF